jgi:predicted butyrate kinase (DUF1464 family)
LKKKRAELELQQLRRQFVKLENQYRKIIMFGSSKEVRKSGTIERIGFASTGEMSSRYVLLLVGEAVPVILQNGVFGGEYVRVVEHLALTASGDEVEFVLKDTTLKSFANRTLDARLGAG